MLGIVGPSLGGAKPGASEFSPFGEAVFIGSAQSSTSPIAAPSGVRAGDLLILILGSTNGNIPATPEGFSALFGFHVTMPTNPVQGRAVRGCTRMATGVETSFSFEAVDALILVFRDAEINSFNHPANGTSVNSASANVTIEFPRLADPPAGVYRNEIGYVAPYFALSGIHGPVINAVSASESITLLGRMAALSNTREFGRSSLKTYTTDRLNPRYGYVIGIRGKVL